MPPMFLFRWIKRLVVLVLLIAGVLYIADYKWNDRPVKEHIAEAYKSGLLAEGWKDIKTWVGEIFTMGKKVAKVKEQLADKDRGELEKLIKNELKENVLKLKEDAEKKGEEK